MKESPVPRARTLTGMTVNLDKTGVPARPSAPDVALHVSTPRCRTAMAAMAARSEDHGRHHRHGPGRRAGPSGLRGRAHGPCGGLGGFDEQGPAGVQLVGFSPSSRRSHSRGACGVTA